MLAMEELFPELKPPAMDWINSGKVFQEPAFWIAEVQILEELSPGAIIRKIDFKKGLNIVWSEGGRPDGPEEERGRGHGAGKTALCRLIRYLLGESHFGNRFTRDRIADNLSLRRAYVAARIFIGETEWSVLRPLYVGGKHFAIKDVDIDTAIRTSPDGRITHEAFIDILQEAVLQRLPLRFFGGGENAPIQWGHLIQPFTRDQEAHLSSLHRWRATESGAEPLGMSDSDRAFLMRCILGIANPAEGEKLRKRSLLQEENKNSENTITIYRQVARDAVKTLQDSDPEFSMPITPEDDFLINRLIARVRAEAENKIAQAEEKIAALRIPETVDAITALQSRLGYAKGGIGEREEHLTMLTTRLDSFKSLKNPTPEDEAQLSTHLQTYLRKGNKYCSVPIDQAYECPVYWRLGIGETLKAASSETFKQSKVQQFEREIRSLEEGLKSPRAEIARMDREQTSLQTMLQKANARKPALDRKIREIREIPTDKERVARNLLDALTTVEKSRKSIKANNDTIEKLEVELEALRKQSTDVQWRVSAIFNALLQSIAGRHFSGELKFTKIDINASISRFNEIESEAHKALKAIAYDLTGLLATFHGIGHHPGFLMQDSPRESDLEPSIYQPYFHAIHNLAATYPNTFQCIVTTTENPPVALQTTPPVCLKLSSGTETEFLFRQVL